MRALLLLATLATPLNAGAPARVVHASFPAAYTAMVRNSMAADPMYGSRLLNDLSRHLGQVLKRSSAAEIELYLRGAAFGGDRRTPLALRTELGSRPMAAEKAAALLLANGLARPEQFREMLDRLETVRSGLGKQTAALLRDVDGGERQNRAVREYLRQLGGSLKPSALPLTYDARGVFNRFFDGTAGEAAIERDAVDARHYTGDDPDGRTRRNGLRLPPRAEPRP